MIKWNVMLASKEFVFISRRKVRQGLQDWTYLSNLNQLSLTKIPNCSNIKHMEPKRRIRMPKWQLNQFKIMLKKWSHPSISSNPRRFDFSHNIRLWLQAFPLGLLNNLKTTRLKWEILKKYMQMITRSNHPQSLWSKMDSTNWNAETILDGNVNHVKQGDKRRMLTSLSTMISTDHSLRNTTSM
jgi:hypothetical protein